MRKLASIQKIISLSPIPNADKIEKAIVLGWEVVVAKSENFKVGDLVVYIEIDSIVPPKPEFEFLKDRKYRVRTIKLRQQVSQGLILPLSILPRGKYQEGDDVTSILNIKKYDPEGEAEQKLLNEKLSRNKNKLSKFLLRYSWYKRLLFLFFPKKNKSFPSFIKKTDEDRIQLFPDICEREKDTKFSITEKIDGQSATYFLVKNKSKLSFFQKDKYLFGVCSRNIYLPKPDNSSYWSIAKKYNIQEALEKIIKDISMDYDYIILQGEIIGPNIQGNKYKVEDYDFYAFNLILPDRNIESGSAKFMLDSYNIKFVPILNHCNLLSSIPEMVEYSKGNSLIGDTKREGIVCRSYQKGISFKVINPEFLLKYEV